MRKLLLPLLAFGLLGCNHGPAPSSVSVGMTRDQVLAALGPGLTTGTKTDNINGHRWERLTFKSGIDGLVVELDDNKVTKSYIAPNKVNDMAKKVRQGMSAAELITALGQPMSGYDERRPNDPQLLIYGDPVAPVQTLNINIQNGKVVRSVVMDNDIYKVGAFSNMPQG